MTRSLFHQSVSHAWALTFSCYFVRVHRYVELRNGLRVLLVSDLNRSDGVSCDGPEDTDTDLEESEEDDEDYSGQSSEAGGDSMDSSREHKTGKTGSSEKQV